MSNSNIEYVGVLATKEEVEKYTQNYKNDPVFVNNNNELQFLIKIISQSPDVNSTEEIFCTSYSRYLEGCGFYDNLNTYIEDRIKAFSEYIKDYLFILKYYEKYVSSGKYLISEDLKVFKKPSTYSDGTIYYAVPTFSPIMATLEFEQRLKKNANNANEATLSKTYSNFKEFIHALENRRAIGKIINFNTAENNNPKMLFWKDMNSDIKAIGPLPKCTYAIGGLCFQTSDLRCVEFKDGDYDSYICDEFNNPTLIHISKNHYQSLLQTLDTSESVNNYINNTIMPAPEAESKNIIENAETLNKTEKKEIEELDDEGLELRLLTRFKLYAQQDDLYYDEKDLINFHTAIKTGSLVILSGMSGTGKSKLVSTYAKALGISENDGKALIIPVRPNWNDDSDLLGHVDLIHMVYRPGDTGFCKLLVEASKANFENKDSLYLVCFDEMNLSRVEHYFSQFLSILEKSEGQRKLRLYDSALAGKLYNSAEYPDVIEIGSNIMFVGTVNIDETTHHFSDKVLDRSNVIKLKILNYNEWQKKDYGLVPHETWKASDFKNIKNMEVKRLTTEYKDFLWELHKLLQCVSSNLGVGPRIMKQISCYLDNIPVFNEMIALSVSEAFDLQIVQRIVTKIRGSEEQFGEFLGIRDNKSISIFKLLDDYSAISEFKETRAALEQKIKELKLYGYCL